MEPIEAHAGPLAVDPVVDQRRLRDACGAFATGVTVITVGGATPHGMTANSFTAVSLDPPLVLVCVGRGAVMHACLSAAPTFGVSVLASGHERVARYFADSRRPVGATQFDAVEWAPGPVTGVPLIAGALAYFECALWRRYDGGDHTIFLGRALSAERRDEGSGLLFHYGRFRTAEDRGDQT